MLTHVYVEPNAGVTPIVQIINSARREVNLETYFLSDRKILNALKSAEKRGVKVRIMLEEKPYDMPSWKVQKEKREALATGAAFKWSPYRFTSHGNHWAFDHSKFVCDTTTCEIGSPNFGWADFHRNRDYLVTTSDHAIVAAANSVFNADWTRQHAPQWAHRVLVLSPGTSQAQLLSVISQPGPIEIESEELGDDGKILNAIAAKGKMARLILPANISAQDRKNAEWLVKNNVQVRLLPVRPIFLHAKYIGASNVAFVGSENLSMVSLEDNREVGVLLHNPTNLQILSDTFNKDWANANPIN
ncbi:phospholipase D-like domain-containing protein [Acidithiobacillus thiooxidans]|uniref:phospholipase D-like domain-containing protein n=1 Tax=Acidithiobacillus thiooxidans TaxID=930 RepID=UPI0009D9CD8D|nr:phospholipase D-like domain-containing protein [Acidithiobacillus thiooxidans]